MLTTGQRRDRSLPRPTWLPDGRSWVNSSSMSELGIVWRYVVFECERCEVDRSGENLTSSIPLFLSKINNKFTQ
jgi:hypothetical protein